MPVSIVSSSSTEAEHLASVDVKFSGLHIGGGVYFSANHQPEPGGSSSAIPQRSLDGESAQHSTTEFDFTLPGSSALWGAYLEDLNSDGTDETVLAGFDISLHVGEDLGDGFYDGFAIPLLITLDPQDLVGLDGTITGYPAAENSLNGSAGVLHETTGTITGHTDQEVSGDEGGFFTVLDAEVLGGMSGGGLYVDFDPDGDGTSETFAVGSLARSSTIDYPDPLPDVSFAQVASFSAHYEDLADTLENLTGDATRVADDFARMTVISGLSSGSTDIIFNGTFFNEDIYGGSNDDTLRGAEGADQLFGGAGGDSLDGGAGLDTVEGGAGSDALSGGADDDILRGQSGSDSLTGGTGNDTGFGGTEGDTVSGEAGDDSLMGEAGDDLIDGGADNDTLVGGTGEDTLLGGDGLDALLGGEGDDQIDGGAGDDMLFGSDGVDTLIGGEGDDTLDGGDGADVLTGGAGTDTFVADVGDSAESDEITDFSASEDVLDLSLYFSSIEAVLDATVETGDDVEINLSEGDLPAATGAGTLTVLDTDIATLSTATITVTCFTLGTEIATASGTRPIESLIPGDKVLTRDNGLQTILRIEKRVVSGEALLKRPELRPVVIQKGALGPNRPLRDLVVSPQHRMLVQVDGAEVLIPAIKLCTLPGIWQQDDAPGVSYFHVLTGRHEILLAEGCECESFWPGEQALAGLPPALAAEYQSLFGKTPLPARPLAEPAVARQLVHRLHLDGTALQQQRFVPASLEGGQSKGAQVSPRPQNSLRLLR